MAILKPKEMAERLNVTVKTLQIWDKKGTLKAYRTPTNRRYYTEEQYLKYIGQSDKDNRKIAAYARVSTNGQKGDLKIKLTSSGNTSTPKASSWMKSLLISAAGLTTSVRSGMNFLMK